MGGACGGCPRGACGDCRRVGVKEVKCGCLRLTAMDGDGYGGDKEHE
jgi:hypothetical protein